MDKNDRRALLTTSPNPDETLDYITGLQGALQIFNHGKPAHLAIRYVPDRLIVNPEAFGQYLAALSGQEWQTLEQLATTVLSDLSNQLVARWFRVAVTTPEGAYPGLGTHEVLVEDRQPGWDNPSLLSRVETF